MMSPILATKFLHVQEDAPYVLSDTHYIKVNVLPVLPANVNPVIQPLQVNVTVVYLDFISTLPTHNAQHVLQIVPPASLETVALHVLLGIQLLRILLLLQEDINVLLVTHLVPPV